MSFVTTFGMFLGGLFTTVQPEMTIDSTATSGIVFRQFIANLSNCSFTYNLKPDDIQSGMNDCILIISRWMFV
ncbi:MAG: hypothetical protein VX537_04320 [Candidatus Neomarinimicrobiota bacterium]|nr:hypothetical protein [Candidatus Neomarinimicrobiota bacterium]